MKLTALKVLMWVCFSFVGVAHVVVAAPLAGEKAAHRKTGNKDVALQDNVSITQHTTTIGGNELKYTATAGKLVMKNDDGTPKALIFFVAYTKNAVDDLSERPVSFAFNG